MPEIILNQILEEALESQRTDQTFLAVFDLDSTLFDLTARVMTLLNLFSQDPAYRKKYPLECEALKRAEVLQSDWGIADTLARVGLPSSSLFFDELHRHWHAGFFSNDYLPKDIPQPGAVEYVKALEVAGADVMYLTGRDVARMGEGTAKSLRQHGFPLSDGALVLKPDAKLDDARFKLEVLRMASSSYDRVWLFENEPVNLNLIARELPSVGLVFIETTHSGLEQPSDLMHRIQHFRR